MGYAKVTLMSFCKNRVKLLKKRLITNGLGRKKTSSDFPDHVFEPVTGSA